MKILKETSQNTRLYDGSLGPDGIVSIVLMDYLKKELADVYDTYLHLNDIKFYYADNGGICMSIYDINNNMVDSIGISLYPSDSDVVYFLIQSENGINEDAYRLEDVLSVIYKVLDNDSV